MVKGISGKLSQKTSYINTYKNKNGTLWFSPNLTHLPVVLFFTLPTKKEKTKKKNQEREKSVQRLQHCN